MSAPAHGEWVEQAKYDAVTGALCQPYSFSASVVDAARLALAERMKA